MVNRRYLPGLDKLKFVVYTFLEVLIPVTYICGSTNFWNWKLVSIGFAVLIFVELHSLRIEVFGDSDFFLSLYYTLDDLLSKL